MSAFLDDLTRVLVTKDYRELIPIEKALKLIEDLKVSQQQAADAAGVSKRQIQRALAAQRDHRSIGVQGRPTILDEGEVEELRSESEKAQDEGHPLNLKDARQKVTSFYLVHLSPFLTENSFCLLYQVQDIMAHHPEKHDGKPMPTLSDRYLKNQLLDENTKFTTQRPIEPVSSLISFQF